VAIPELSRQSASMDRLPHEIRLIAAVSRLIDIHQSRREGGAYSPDVPDKAGFNLFLALSLIECLHEIEIDRGIGFAPLSELASRVKKRVPQVTDFDVEYCIANLKLGREIHYGIPNADGDIKFARTWDSTPLIEVEEGFSQVQLTENARLLLRVASLKESWLYSDLDADRLVKAIERGQFQDVPAFCRAMTLDLSAKSKQLSGALERPSLTELRALLITEGSSIAESLKMAAETINHAIDLIFSDRVRDEWEKRPQPDFHLGNLQADLELVLQNVESLSRRFVQFLSMAQKVRNEGIEAIRFIQIADSLVIHGNSHTIQHTESILRELMPWGVTATLFHPSMLVGEVDLREQGSVELGNVHGFTMNPTSGGGSGRLLDLLRRNRDVIVQRLQEGPVHFSEMVELTGLTLESGETPLDFFGAYASPGLLSSDDQRIVVGLTDKLSTFIHANQQISGSDPVMFIEEAP
jgi:hypothetical protein